jgi:hypothetical protein
MTSGIAGLWWASPAAGFLSRNEKKKKNNIRSDRRPQLQRKQDEKDEKERENRKECMFQLGWKGDEPSLIYTIV